MQYVGGKGMKDWALHRFDEVFDLQMGKTPDRKTPQYFGGDNVWVSIRDMSKKEIFDSNEHITDEAVVATNIRKVKKGTVIMSFKLTVGKCAIAAKDLYTNEAIMAFNLKEGYDISADFLYYYLQGYKWEGANKAVMGLTLNKATISQHKIGFPSLPEQQSIVAELDKINELISLKKAQLSDLERLTQSMFFNMFGNPVENEKGWIVKSIEEVCSSIVRGPFGSALKKDFFVKPDSTTYKIYEQKHAIQKDATIGSYYVTEDKFKELSRFEVKPNDIIMSCSGTIGELYRIPSSAEKGLMNQALLKFTLSEVIHYQYFLYLMEYIKKDFTVRGTGLQNIGSVKIIKNMSFGLPPLSLQQEFAARIEAIEKQKNHLNSTLKDLETLLASRMQYWFD